MVLLYIVENLYFTPLSREAKCENCRQAEMICWNQVPSSTKNPRETQVWENKHVFFAFFDNHLSGA